MFKIKQCDTFGRGLYATQDVDANTVIMACEILVLSENDTPLVNMTDLKYYTFKFNDTQDCLVLGLGEIFNHDDYENVIYNLEDLTDSETGLTRKVMVFKSKCPIFSGEQLFINYNADIAIDSAAYKNQTSLVG